MINFDSLTLKAQLKEIIPLLNGGRVQKIQQISRRELLFLIRAGGKSHKFYVSIHPSYAHCAVLSPAGEKLRLLEIPQKPPMFCMLLRKYMEGAKIVNILQPESERIIEFCFDSYNELGERTPLILAIELMGKHSNIILYNYDTNVILGCAHNISSEKSRERELAGTLPYIYPPKQKKLNLLQISKEKFYDLAKITDIPFCEWLNNKFFDISLALANEVYENFDFYEIYDKLQEILMLKNLKPCISKDKKVYSLACISSQNFDTCNSVNEMVDLYFGYHIHIDKILKIKTELFSIVNKELKRLNNNMKKLSLSSDNMEKAEKYRQIADTLMANLYNIKKGEQECGTINIHTSESIVISLDETLTPSENAQKYYKLYNKAKNAAVISQKLLSDLEKEKNYMDSIYFSVEQSENFGELLEIKEELSSLNLVKTKEETKQKTKEKRKIELECREIDGFKVYIGKNNKQNDYIISNLSSANDIWLHAQEIPGSHVLIKIPPELEDISENTIYDAAKLAAEFSQAKNSSKVPVIYVKRKFIKKPPGAKPGYVIYKNEKVFIVDRSEKNN